MMEKAGIRVGLTLLIAGVMLFALPVNLNGASTQPGADPAVMSTTLYINDYVFDVDRGEPAMPPNLVAQEPASGMEGLYLVHFGNPVMQEWVDQVKAVGGEIVAYITDYAYEVRMTPEEADAVGQLDAVHWMGLYHPAYKIQPNIEGLDVIVTMNRNSPSLNSGAGISSFFSSGMGSETPYGYIYKGTLANSGLMDDIARDPDVQFIEQHFPEELHDEMGMQITGGYAWINDPDSNINTPYRTLGTHGSYANQLGWDGAGVVIGIADSGLGDGTTPNAGHVDFTGRVIGGVDLGSTVNGWKDEMGHGTHCAGLMAADGYEGTGTIYAGAAKYYAGMGQAHESQIYAVQIFEGASASADIPADYTQILTTAYTAGARVHSNSWGSATAGAYSASDASYDICARDSSTAAGNQQMVIVCSAGNSGSATGTIGSPGNGKNVITVGSYYNYMPDGSNYGYASTDRNNPDTVSSFSSRGWSDHTGGGRIKPDVAAPGEETLSTRSPSALTDVLYGFYTPDTRYQWCSGTSQAAPTVSGGAAVVYQWGTSKLGTAPSAAMVKALLINSAVDMGTADIPNQNEGWGRMYLPPIVNPASQWILKDNQPELTTGNYAELTFSYVSSSLPMKVTLAWTDKATTAGDTTPLVNNLDLRLTSPTGLVYHGNAFSAGVTPSGANPSVTFDINADGWDETNNVECIYIAPGSLQTGTYTLRVTGFNVAGDCDNDGSNDQDYSLAVYNAAQYAHAAATGPLGATNNVAVTLTYDWVGLPTSVNLYYTKTAGASWALAGNDATVDGSYPYTITAGTGTYAWYAAAVGGSTIDSAPTAGTTPEASSLVYDLTAPTAPSNLNVDQYGEGIAGGTNILTTAGTTQAGGPHNVWFTIVDSSAGTELTTPNSAAEFTDAYYTAASTSNDVRAGPSSTPGVGTYEFLKCQFATAIDPATVNSLTLTFEGYFSAALTATMFAWDGSAWDSLGTASIATTDTTMAMTVTTNPGQYLSGGNVLWGVYAGSARRSCTVDYLEVRIENAIPYTTYDDNTLNWTASASGDVDHYNIYRSDLQAGTYTLIGASPVGTNTYQDDAKGQADSTYWWYRVRAVDGAGNEETNTVSVQEPAPTVDPPYAISLTGKAANSWVFVSFPSGLTGNVQTLLNDATAGDGGTTWTIAKWFNPATPADPWKTYRASGTANDMPTVNNQMGFWLYITANGGDQALTLSSYAATPASTVITLAQGWNLVGYPSTTDRPGTVVPSQVDIISAYSSPNTYTDYTNKALVTFHHGNAYFLRSTAATTWTVTEP